MNSRSKTEFGDFQTPPVLARAILAFLKDSGETADAIVEPTCGRGSFVVAAMTAFPKADAIYGFDINPQYVRESEVCARQVGTPAFHIKCQDFFQFDWTRFFASIEGNLLVVGNPPWVTNAALESMGSANLPKKTNFQGHNGFAAKTGKANFDISEWMLIKLLEAMHVRTGCIAMLCKTATARKTLRHAWLNGLKVGRCSLHLIDTKKHFGASVDACLLVAHTGDVKSPPIACVHPDLSFSGRHSTIGLAGKELVADIDEYLLLRDIDGIPYYMWRSGVKHDASRVMEFKRGTRHFINGWHEECRLEETYLFPLLKSSDIANGRLTPGRYALVTQRKPSDDTAEVKSSAPRTWAYLMAHADALDQRRSIIYQNRPRFSIFGVGDYTFAPWKIAISGLYKNCRFSVVGTHGGKPIVLDDTCYFIPCQSETEARFVCDLLNSDVCQRFLRSLTFFDAKRPITIDILNRIDLKRVAGHLDMESEARKYLSAATSFEDNQGLLVFEDEMRYGTKGKRARRAPQQR